MALHRASARGLIERALAPTFAQNAGVKTQYRSNKVGAPIVGAPTLLERYGPQSRCEKSRLPLRPEPFATRAGYPRSGWRFCNYRASFMETKKLTRNL